MGPEIETIYIKRKTRNKTNNFPHSSKAFLIDLRGTTNMACHTCRAMETQTGLWEKDWLQNSEAEKRTSWTRCAESRTLALHPLSTAQEQQSREPGHTLPPTLLQLVKAQLCAILIFFFKQTGGGQKSRFSGVR